MKQISKKYMLFSGILFSMTAVFWLVALITRGESISLYFVPDSTNTYMDYFNMLSNIEGLDPYYQNANYPALPFVIWRIFYRMIPWNEANVDGFFLRNSMYAQLGFILLMLICTITLWELLRNCFGHIQKRTCLLLCISIVFSGTMLFTIERGNIILLAFIFSLVYIMMFDSEKKINRYIAYICLVISAAIKIYPALLGVLVIYRKRYKECFHLIIMGILCFLLPFFAFDGINSLKTMIKGIFISSSESLALGFGYNFSFSNFVRILYGFAGVYRENLPIWLTVIPILLCASVYILNVKLWKKVYALTLLTIWLPSFSYTYTLLFLVLPLILFLKEDYEKSDWIYVVGFALILSPWCLPKVFSVNFLCGEEFKFYLTGGTLIVNLLIFSLTILLAVSGITEKIIREG